MSDAHGELHEQNPLGTTIIIPVAGTFEKWVTASAGLEGPDDLVEVDVANSQLVIGPNGAGGYTIVGSVSFTGSRNSTKEGAIFVNGVKQDKIGFVRGIGAPPNEGAAPLSGMLDLEVGDVVDLRFTADNNGDTIILLQVDIVMDASVRSTA